MGKPKKHRNCPLCRNIELVKVPLTKHTWKCQRCGLIVYPNWQKCKGERRYRNADPKTRITNNKIEAWLRG